MDSKPSSSTLGARSAMSMEFLTKYRAESDVHFALHSRPGRRPRS